MDIPTTFGSAFTLLLSLAGCYWAVFRPKSKRVSYGLLGFYVLGTAVVLALQTCALLDHPRDFIFSHSEPALRDVKVDGMPDDLTAYDFVECVHASCCAGFGAAAADTSAVAAAVARAEAKWWSCPRRWSLKERWMPMCVEVAGHTRQLCGNADGGHEAFMKGSRRVIWDHLRSTLEKDDYLSPLLCVVQITAELVTVMLAALFIFRGKLGAEDSDPSGVCPTPLITASCPLQNAVPAEKLVGGTVLGDIRVDVGPLEKV
eukprot:g2351.t1